MEFNDRSNIQPDAGSQPFRRDRKRLGEFLVDAGLVTPSHVKVALVDQGSTGHRIGEIMVLRGWVDQETLDSMVQIQAHAQAFEPEESHHPRLPEVPTPSRPSPRNQVIVGSCSDQPDADTLAMNLDELKAQLD